MARDRPPYRADHIGSLIRPAQLLCARYPTDGQNLQAEELKAIEDRQIRNVISMQEDIGLQSITDGEFRRESWRLGLVSKVSGFTRTDAVGDVDYQHDSKGHRHRIGNAPIATSKVEWAGPIVADEVAFTLSHTTATAKATIPSPSYLHYPRGSACVDDAVYPDLDQYFEDVVHLYRRELKAICETGCCYLQFDEVVQALLCDETIRLALKERGDCPDALCLLYIDLINRIIRDRPPQLCVTLHMCRGNAMGGWMGSGSYEHVAETIFNSLDVDAFFLEYDSERAGGFEPLRFIPEDKLVVLGLISTKTPLVESRSALCRQIEAAAAFVPLERLCLSPQCGFASADLGTELTESDQFAKLQLVVDTATEIWDEPA